MRSVKYMGFTASSGAEIEYGTNCVLLNTQIGLGANPFVQIQPQSINLNQVPPQFLNQFQSQGQFNSALNQIQPQQNNFGGLNQIQTQQNLQNSFNAFNQIQQQPNFGNQIQQQPNFGSIFATGRSPTAGG